MKFIKAIFNSFRPDPKPEKVTKTKTPYKYRRKPTGERELFLEIWNERPHFCQVCGDNISTPTPTNFLHILPKAQNKYPLFKLNKQNIVLGCPFCHYAWDFNRSATISEKEWKWVHELEASLKDQYKNL